MSGSVLVLGNSNRKVRKAYGAGSHRIEDNAGPMNEVSGAVPRQVIPVVAGITFFALMAYAHGQIVGNPTRGRAVFEQYCVLCHGSDAKGMGLLAKTLPVPPADLTDCRRTSEDPVDVIEGTIRHGGSYVRLSPVMPAWQGTLTDEQITDAASYVKTLCRDPDWVPGELNLPRPLITDKAYPEQEAIVGGRLGRGPSKTTEAFGTIEYRLNGLTNVELTTSYLNVRPDGGQPDSGLGDSVLSLNRVVAFSQANRWLTSAGLGLGLPTGSQSRGLGSGDLVWEPFVRGGWDWHQVVIQGDAVLSLPQKNTDVNSVFMYDVAIGRYFKPEPRMQITPMIEFNSETPLNGPTSSVTKSVVLPEIRVQWLHWSTAVGVQVPITGARDFNTRPMFDFTYEF